MSVRIDYEINPQGEPKVRSLADALGKLRQEESSTADQFLQSALAADKAASALDTLQKALQTLTGQQNVDLGVTKALDDVRTSISDVLGLAAKLESQRVAIQIDDTDVKRATGELRAYLALKREVDESYRRSEVNAAARGAERINVVRNQRTSDIDHLSGVVPERDLADLERRAHEAADRDILTQNLRPVEQRVIATERTNQRDETKLEEHPDQTRIANNEALRQRLLLLAQTEEDQKRVNALVDRLNEIENTQSGLKYRLDAKSQEIRAQEQLDAIVESSQKAELSRLEQIEATRKQALSELGGILPGSEPLIDQAFDQQASAERQRLLARSLAPVERAGTALQASDTKAQEDAAYLEGKEKAVFELRQRSLEITRQEQLAIAKTAEEENIVNAAINRRIEIERNHAGLQADIRLRQEQLAVEQAVANLVEKTNQAQVSGVARIRAEQQGFSAQYGKTPELQAKIDQSFDRRAAQEEESSGTHGNPRRLLLGAKDLAFGYSRGALLQGFDYLLSLRGGAGAAGGEASGAGGSGGGGILSGLGLGGLSGGAQLGLAAGAAAAGLAAVTIKLTEFVEKEAEAARETVNLGQRMGITGAQAQQLADAAKIVGVNIASVEGGARLLSTALEDPSGAGRKAAEGLTKLGISIIDVNGKAREMGPVFLDALTAISKLPSAAERMALATRLLGRGAKELEPLIADYDALNKVVTNLHPVDPTKLAEADKKFQELHQHWEELKRDFATKLVPVIEPIVSGASGLLTGKNREGQSPTDVGTEAEFVRQQRHPGFLSNLLNALSPYATTIPTAAEHKAYLAQFGPEALAKRRNEPFGPQIPQSVYDTSAREASRYLSGFHVDDETRRAELGEQLKEAQTRQKAALDVITDIQKGAGRSNRVTPDVVTKNETDLTAASRDVARIQAQIKAIEAAPRTENRFEAERDRIAAEDYKAQHPASDFGRIPELQIERQERLGNIRRDPQFTPAERSTLTSDIERQSNRDIILEARRVAGNQEFKRFGEQRIDTAAGIQGLQSQFALAQRIAALQSGGKDETEKDVEQAYQKQLELARQIRDIHLNDLQIEREKHAATGDHSHDADLAKEEASAHKQFVDEQVRAEGERAERNAAIVQKQREEEERTQQELGKLQTEIEARSFADKIEHAQRLADINRLPGEAPTASIQSAYETRLKLAQLEHDTVVAENAITYSGQDPETIAKGKIADREAYNNLVEEGQKAEYEREERLAELRKQERDEAKQQAASLYDALRGGPKSTREFFKAQLNDIGRNLFSAGLAPFLQGASNVINPSGGGLIGTALRGTILGSSTGASQAQAGQGVQQPTGLFGRFEHLLGIGPPHPQQPAINTPVVASHTEPLIASLDSNRDAIHDLTAAILGVTPGGGVGPNPLAQHPLPASATAQEALPGVTELGAASLVQSSKNAVDAVHALAQNQPLVPGPVDFSPITDLLPEPVKPPISIFGQEEETPERQSIQPPHFSPHIHVQPSPLSVLSPVTGPSYSSTVSNAYHDGGKSQAPIAVPQREQVTSKISYGTPGDVGTPISENLSPHGFPILGGNELAATALTPGILSGAGTFHPDTHGIHVAAPLPESTTVASGDTDILSFLKNAFTKTTDTFNVENMLHAIDSAAESLKAGDVKGAIQSLDPSLSKIGDDTIQKIQKGDYSGALANVLPLTAPLAGEVPTPSEALAALSNLKLPADHPLVQALRDETGSIGPGSGLSRSEIAKAAAKPADAARQAAADQMEIKLSRYLGIPRTEGTLGTNAPFDLQNDKVGVEIKTIFDNANDKITMKRDALDRKNAAIEAYGLQKAYTVVADTRGSKPQYSYREGLGSFRLSSLTPARTLADLKQAITDSQLPIEQIAPELTATQRFIRALSDETGGIGPGSGQKPTGQQTFYHGTSAPFFTHFKGDLVYLTKSPQEAQAFADNPIIGGGRGAGDSRVLTVQGRLGKTKDINPAVEDALIHDDDLDEVIAQEAAKARKEKYSYLQFRHPSASGNEDFDASISLYPQRDLTIAPQLPQEQIPEELSATERFINRPIPAPEPSPISSLFKSPYGFDILGDKDLASTALSPGILADSSTPKKLNSGQAIPLASPYAKQGPWLTTLNPDQERRFQAWVRANHIPFDSSPNADYDMRGYWLANNGLLAETKVSDYDGLLHFPDTYKTPYHRTFSNESRYATPDAPHWENDRLVDNSGHVIADETPTTTEANHTFAKSANVIPQSVLSSQTDYIASTFENYAASQFPSIPAVPSLLASLPAQFQPPSFATQHPTIARTGGTIAQLAALSAPAAIRSRDELGDLQYNPYAIGTAAYGDVGILLNAFDRRKSASTSKRGKIFDQIEALFGVPLKPAPKKPTPPGQAANIPASPHTAPTAAPGQLIPTTIPHFDAYDSRNLKEIGITYVDFASAQQYQGFAPTTHPFPEDEWRRDNRPVGTSYVIQRATGARSTLVDPNTPTPPGTTTVVLDTSGRILEIYGSDAPKPQQSQVSSRFHPTTIESISTPGTSSLPAAADTPAFNATERSLFGIPSPPPYQSVADSPVSRFTLETPNNQAIHDAVLHSGLSGTHASFTSLPQSVLDAAAPLGTPLAAFNTFGTGISGFNQGLKLAGLGTGPASFSGAPNPSASESYSAGQIPTQTGQTVVGSLDNAGYSLTKLDSGLILREPLSQSGLGGTPAFNSAENSLFGLPTPPPFTDASGLGSGDSSFPETPNLDIPTQSLPDQSTSAITAGLGGGLPSAPDTQQPSAFAKAIGNSVAIFGGVEGVLAGLHQGGARGDLTVAGSALGTAAYLDPEPISKAVLGIAAGVTAMIHAFLPDPRAQREKHLAQEEQTGKLAALPYTQPGINVVESAAGGKSVDTDFQGNSRVLNSKPYVYDINEAVGFDPIHPNRVVTQAVRQVGYTPLPGVPVAPLASTDLTTPVRAMNDTTAYAGTTGSAAQIATQAQQNSALSNVIFNNTWNNHSIDSADIMRRAADITTAVQSQLLTSHRIVQDIKNLSNVT
jgi:hypothetical protein